MFEQEIEKGVAFLDEKMPNWLDRVDPEKLDMKIGIVGRSRCGCVLAQYGAHDGGDYYRLIYSLGIEGGDYRYGFSVPPDRPASEWDMLTVEWQAKLLELKAED
jgi:hypothetical protein